MSETFTPDRLIAGDFPIVTEEMVITGESLTRGTVVGKITASGKGVVVNSGGTDDGRRTAYGVLLETADATAADKTVTIALTGEFNEDELVFGGTDTITTHRATLRGLCIFAKDPVSA